MGTEGENLPKLIEQFQQTNPGVKVTVTPIPWDAAHNKFTTAITAQTLPDAAMVGTTWMGEFADLGALDPTPQGISLFDWPVFGERSFLGLGDYSHLLHDAVFRRVVLNTALFVVLYVPLNVVVSLGLAV